MNPWIRRLFLVVSIGGGFLGFAATIGQLFQGGQPVIYYLMCSAVAFGYACGIYGGLMLIENPAMGLVVLSWYFLAQVPVLVSSVASYQFSSGFTANALLGSNGLSWAFFIGSRWQVSFFQFGEKTLACGMNFVALWATWYLRRQLAMVASEDFRARKRANQSPEPTAMSVTPPAAQESRQP